MRHSRTAQYAPRPRGNSRLCCATGRSGLRAASGALPWGGQPRRLSGATRLARAGNPRKSACRGRKGSPDPLADEVPDEVEDHSEGNTLRRVHFWTHFIESVLKLRTGIQADILNRLVLKLSVAERATLRALGAMAQERFLAVHGLRPANRRPPR
jgi:hypothetical protein